MKTFFTICTANLSTVVLSVMCCCFATIGQTAEQLVVYGETVHTMSGPPIKNGVVIVRDGKIAAVGQAGAVTIPQDARTLKGKVVMPGLVDAHSSVGLSGIFNYDHDQDQLERSAPIQPELRALDAFNPREPLIDWIRSFGVTTVHTGHSPGELLSGQTLVVKTDGNTVEAAALLEPCAVAATLAESALKEDAASPGTRGKMLAMLRTEFIKAKEYLAKRTDAESAAETSRDLRLETLGAVLEQKLPLLVTAHRAQDIAGALRLADEFDLRLWLDGGAEAYLLIEEIQAAGIPVIVHPSMARPLGEMQNFSFETAAKLAKAGIPIALQSGYEAYVPKNRVLLFEAAFAVAHGLPRDKGLAVCTIEAARILGVADRVGSLEVGKDGDIAVYDGDPFEYTTHCTAVIIEGEIVSDQPR